MNTEGADVFMPRVVEAYSKMLLHLALARLPCEADAEDCVQEVFLKLLRQGDRFRSEEHEKAWLIRVTLNEACDMLRSRDRRNVSLEDVGELPTENRDNYLLSAVRALPDKYAAVLHLYYYEGCTIKEIAKLLSVPLPTAASRLSRGRELLKAQLEE